MLIPWNTDAPLYHFPWATIGLIVVNTAVYFSTAEMDPDQTRQWCLAFGDGLHPLQWLTNNFMHDGFMHLAGNMIFLWPFGLVVEGKLGWLRFLPLYLAMATVDGLIVQLVMLHGQGYALGASGVIYALLAIAMIWAPNSEFGCVLLVTFRPVPVQVSAYVFAILYLTLELTFAFFNEFAMSSEMLHLIGAAIGSVVGFAMLKADLVDCEGEDLISVVTGRQGELPVERPERSERPAPIERELQIIEAERQIQECLQAGHPVAAFKLAERAKQQITDWELPERDLVAIIRLLHRDKQWQASIAPTVQYLKRFPENSAALRLKFGQILLVHEHRPYRAISVLTKLTPGSLTPEQAALSAKLIAAAQRQLEDADLELADEDW